MMPYPSSINSFLICSKQRLAYRFQHRTFSFFFTVYHHRVGPPRSSHALTSRTFHSSPCNHGRTIDGYELTHPRNLKSRRDNNHELSGNDDNNKTLDSGESFTDVPGTTNTKGKTLAIIYTCKVCNTRSAKQFTEQAYKHGVVLVKCPGCENHHLIADRLGWFEDRGVDGKGWDVERLLAEVGENVRAVSGNDVLELTLDDIAGTKS